MHLETVEKVKILNITGKTVCELNTNGLDVVKIDVRDYKAGVYFILLSTEDNVRSMKFIKE